MNRQLASIFASNMAMGMNPMIHRPNSPINALNAPPLHGKIQYQQSNVGSMNGR